MQFPNESITQLKKTQNRSWGV